MQYHIPYCNIDRKQVEDIVSKHTKSQFKRPISSNHQQIAFELANITNGQKFIWDWGSGTAASSVMLAKLQPEYLIISVDQSLARLKRNQYFEADRLISRHENLIIIRANIVDLIHCWQGEKAERQYWLHQNPWPKAKNLLKRWPLHPIFPKAMLMAKHTDMRTNWLSYAQNWQLACKILEFEPKLSIYNGLAFSAFERKYQSNNSQVYQVVC